MICFKCGKYGHKENVCFENKGKDAGGGEKPPDEGGFPEGGSKPESAPPQTQPKQTRADISTGINNPTVAVQVREGSTGEQDPDFEPWMIAPRRNKIKNKGRSIDLGKKTGKAGEKNKQGDKPEFGGEKSGHKGSCFDILHGENEHIKEKGIQENPIITFIGTPQNDEKFVASTLKIRNANGGKNPQRNLKGKNKKQGS